MALSEEDWAQIVTVVAGLAAEGTRELTSFYGPRLLFLERAVAFLMDEARPRIMSSGDSVRIQRMAHMDSELKNLIAEIQRRDAELRHGPHPPAAQP